MRHRTRLTNDPQNEETPGVATPGGPRDIPVGKTLRSMKTGRTPVKESPANVNLQRMLVGCGYRTWQAGLAQGASSPGSSGSMPARHSPASAAAWPAAPQSAADAGEC